jgi:thermopsin
MLRTVFGYALVVSTIVLLVASAGASGLTTDSSHGLGVSQTSTPSPAASVAPSATPTAAANAPSSAREQAILQELRGSGIPQSDIHLPDLSVAAPYAGEQVAPTYSSAPAPMGVADLGLTNDSGRLVGSVLDTSSVEGTITLNNALSVNVDGDGPDMFGIQLNAVVTGVTLFGNSSDQFWMQNFVSYTPSSGELVFGDNVWNFSNYYAYISPNVFYATGPNGTLYAPVYYYAIGPTFTIHYPFTITFYENSTVMFDRPAVFFNYTVSNSTMRTSGSYDYVVFNASAGKVRKAFPAGEFQINGNTVDPVGLPNDLELDVVGNDDGDTTTFYQMDATLSIATWDSSTHEYTPVRSAMDAGSETGETSDGVDVSYAGSTPVATMRLGPSFIYGLWGESKNSGARTVVQTLDPAPTFIFVNPGTTENDSAAQWVMSSPTGTTTFYVPNGGAYWLQYLLSERDPGHALLTGAANSTTPIAFTGTLNLHEGVYTPLIAFGNAELASLSSGGVGSLSSPYVLYNNEYGTIDSLFATWNDYQFPVFPGVLLIGTSAYVTVTPPSFQIDYPSWMTAEIQEFGLPSTNNLQLQFWETSDVRVLGGTISGWLSAFLEGFPEGSVMFWNSSDNLVAGSTFADEGDALVLYGGTSNTIWGNTFDFARVSASAPEDVLNYGPMTQAINESESGDLIYNNYVDVPFPAITPNYDPLSCQIECESASYVDVWNVSLQPASDVKVVDGVDLSGSILGLKTEGGNYWSNYGSQTDPFGVLPYNNGGNIENGGDYLPLERFTLDYLEISESGLPTGTFWSVTLNGITENSTGRTITFADPSGSYSFQVGSVRGFSASPSRGTVDLNHASQSLSVTFSRNHASPVPPHVEVAANVRR